MPADPNDWPEEAREAVALAVDQYLNLKPFTLRETVDRALTALTPFVAARVAAAEEAAARGMRESCNAAANNEARLWGAEKSIGRSIARNIRALPLPTSPLAAAERAAEARGRVAGLREAAGAVIQRCGCNRKPDENNCCEDVAAILALAEKEGA